MVNETYHSRGELVHGYLVQDHPLYSVWADMKSRCRVEGSAAWDNYGGRGITYDRRWAHFKNFAEDMGLRPFEGATLDRIDNDKGYGPDNCRWADRTEQCLNRRMFKNNTSGATGAVSVAGGRFVASYDAYGVRYNLGRFASAEECARARLLFSRVIVDFPDLAERMMQRRVRYDSSTQRKNITIHKDGYVVRYTLNGERVYLGLYRSLEDAENRLADFEELLAENEAVARATIGAQARSNSKSGVRGITPKDGKFIVRCKVGDRRVYVGRFSTLEEAVDAKTRFEK